MPTEKKKKGARAPEKDKKTETKKSEARGKASGDAKKRETDTEREPRQYRCHAAPDPDSVGNRVLPYLFLLVAVLVTVFLISGETSGFLGGGANTLLFGLFGNAAWALAIVLLLIGGRWRSIVRDDFRGASFLFACGTMLCLSAVFHLIPKSAEVIRAEKISAYYGAHAGGGFLGGVIAKGLVLLIGKVGALIVLFVLFFVSLMFMLSVTPRDVAIYFRYYARIAAERRAERSAERERLHGEEAVRMENRRRELNEIRRRAALDVAVADSVDEAEETPAEPAKPVPVRSRRAEPAMPEVRMAQTYEDPAVLAEDDPEEAETPLPSAPPEEDEEEATVVDLPGATVAPLGDEPAAPTAQPGSCATTEKEEKKEETAGRVILPDLDDIFNAEPGEDPGLSGLEDAQEQTKEMTETKQSVLLGEEPPKPKAKPKTEYRAPAITLLNLPDKPKTEGLSAEMQEKAQRLVETLASFRVYVTVTSISVGPSITRYELCPESGTSVKSIANRADDISLSLASTVRIEAPIPGKSAVGIEVPNKTRISVYLRELIANKQFSGDENKKRKLLACLGEDVTGAPIYCDLSKMPHLLIAGTTGSGKSVCINSLIISLLYRCSPDDLRMILIDPKHVELKPYNNVPHLLLPVVSEPEKAAGALSWAVNEMERRYRLIEEVGARNIAGYNEIVNGVDGYERLPYIVIIIDELADLMLVTRDTVEQSINRIAAKARAAGMHLVIGTQRPSVDVITGLIKANISSRIAFTVISQVDSRTIIDVAGAEKLTGMGDMLYSPIGAMKPTRIQGAFVSDEEIERVTSYLRAHAGEAEYNEEVMADIEREAQRFADGGKKALADGEEGDADAGELDPKFREALELAVSQSKIATSMLQRALKVGYGRAARIIDDMERLGYVGPPDGTKPREVLITMQQFRELVVQDRVGERTE